MLVAALLVYVTSRGATASAGVSTPLWLRVVQWAATIGWVIWGLVQAYRDDRARSAIGPGGAAAFNPGDKQFVDRAWTPIHTFAGVVLGLWLTPLVVVMVLTLGWELFEISVPGFGDEEINSNRLSDVGVAWLGWLVGVLVAGVGHGLLVIPVV